MINSTVIFIYLFHIFIESKCVSVLIILMQQAYAASFVKRCCLLAPQPLKDSEDNAGETRCKLDHDVVTEECCDELAVTIIERALYPYHQSCKLDAKPFVTTGTSMTPSESSVSVPSQCRDISWKPWL